MAQPDLRGKTKKDLAAIAHISGLLRPTDTSRMTKQQLLDFLLSVSGDTQTDTGYAERTEPVRYTAEDPVTPEPDPRHASIFSTVEAAEPETDDAPAPEPVQIPAEASAADHEAVQDQIPRDAAVSDEKPAVKRRGRKKTAAADKRPAPEAQETPRVRDNNLRAEEQTRDLKDSGKENAGKRMAAEGRKASVPAGRRATVRKVKPFKPTAAAHSEGDAASADDGTPPAKDASPARAQNGRSGEPAFSQDAAESGSLPSYPAREPDFNGNVPLPEDEEAGDDREEHPQEIMTGILEIMPEGYGFLRIENYIQSGRDIYVPPQYIRRFNLRTGDEITGPVRQQRDNDRYKALFYIREVNGETPDKMIHRPHFDRLTPIYPRERYTLETVREELSTRIVDLICPIGKGQRGMIVSPPKAGKTIFLQKIANAITKNNPETKLIVLLIDERPEEVTDMQRSIQGEVVYSTFDKTPENHVRITELVLERAERLVELGHDVVILLDSITRMGRAYNLTINPTGRTLSGGLDPGALYGPKRFFGAARNIEHGGSLTIIATALVETGSRMDEVIFEEFKGTGNMEVILDRKLADRRIFPAIDITRSGTRREELLLSERELDAVWMIRKAFSQLETATVTETMLNLLLKTRDNDQFIASIKVSMSDKSLYDAMRGSALKRAPAPGSNGAGSASPFPPPRSSMR